MASKRCAPIPMIKGLWFEGGDTPFHRVEEVFDVLVGARWWQAAHEYVFAPASRKGMLFCGDTRPNAIGRLSLGRKELLRSFVLHYLHTTPQPYAVGVADVG